MKATRYRITVYDSVLSVTHGFGQTIDEILVGKIFINEAGVWENYADRMKGAVEIKEVEFDDGLYDILIRFVEFQKCVNKNIKKMLKTKGDITPIDNQPIFCWDDFEKKYLPKTREERLKKEETPEQHGERLAKETIANIQQDLHKHKLARRKK
jgi:hypothetical protein